MRSSPRTGRGWRQSLATRSQQAYAAQVARFLTWLVCSEHGACALADPHVRDWAVRDYKRHVKQALAAIDNFYRSLGAGRPDVPREDLPQLAPGACAGRAAPVPAGRRGLTVAA